MIGFIPLPTVLNMDRADAVNMSLPYVVDQLPADISVLSPQVDERPRKPRKYCVQGFINLVNLTIY